MAQSSRLSSFQKLALWTLATTYFLILVGGLVRASGSGLGCPDWPRCFGSWVPPLSAADLPPGISDADRALFNPTQTWTEYLNRLLGVSVGFLILGTTISAWRHHRHEPRILWTTIAALLLTGFQGWLGGSVVKLGLRPWIVTAHLIVALIIVQLLLYATVNAWRKPSSGVSPSFPTGAVLALIIVTMVQIGFGTQVRGSIDTALKDGVARASTLSTVGTMDQLHREAAFFVMAGSVFIAFWLKALGGPAVGWAYVVAGLAFLQVALGGFMAYISLAPAAQVGHLTIASLLLGAETTLLLLGRQLPRNAPDLPSTIS
jgi:cytochrome c oxidase assembly protein subunit 15